MELNRSTGVQSLQNGVLGATALGNGGFAIARAGSGGTIDLFAYDGTTLAETGNNLTDPNRRSLDNGFVVFTPPPLHSVTSTAEDVDFPISTC